MPLVVPELMQSMGGVEGDFNVGGDFFPIEIAQNVCKLFWLSNTL